MFSEVVGFVGTAGAELRKATRKLRKLVRKAMPRRARETFYCDPARGLFGCSNAANRLIALEDVIADADGCTVLDLGCAEGLMAERFLERDACQVTAFDIKPGRIVMARRLMPTARARFEVGDLSDWSTFERSHRLSAVYDIVLFLGIYQHLPNASRAATLRGAAQKARYRLALRVPAELLMEADAILRDAGLIMVTEKRGNGLGVSRFRLYQRPGECRPAKRGDASGESRVGPHDARPDPGGSKPKIDDRVAVAQ